MTRISPKFDLICSLDRCLLSTKIYIAPLRLKINYSYSEVVVTLSFPPATRLTDYINAILRTLRRRG